MYILSSSSSSSSTEKKMKKTTSILIDSELHEQAKLLNIPLGRTLEEALIARMNKNELIDELKDKLREKRKEVREIKTQIEEIEERQREEIETRGNLDERFEKAISICHRIDKNEIGISNDRIAEVAKIQNVPALELIDRYRSKYV